MKNNLGVSTLVRTQMSIVSMRERAARRFAEDRGAAMAEYGLLLALVALAAVAILAIFGGEIRDVFLEAEETLENRDTVVDPD